MVTHMGNMERYRREGGRATVPVALSHRRCRYRCRMGNVAFRRAINTGNRRIKMADLRQVYIDLGADAAVHESVATGGMTEVDP